MIPWNQFRMILCPGKTHLIEFVPNDAGMIWVYLNFFIFFLLYQIASDIEANKAGASSNTSVNKGVLLGLKGWHKRILKSYMVTERVKNVFWMISTCAWLFSVCCALVESRTHESLTKAIKVNELIANMEILQNISGPLRICSNFPWLGAKNGLISSLSLIFLKYPFSHRVDLHGFSVQ